MSRREYQDNDNSLSQEPEVDCLALFLVPRVQLGKLEKRLVVGTFTKGSRSFSVRYYYYMVTSSYTLSCPSRYTNTLLYSILCMLSSLCKLPATYSEAVMASFINYPSKGYLLIWVSWCHWNWIAQTNHAIQYLKLHEEDPCRVHAWGLIQLELSIWHRRWVEAMYSRNAQSQYSGMFG